MKEMILINKMEYEYITVTVLGAKNMIRQGIKVEFEVGGAKAEISIPIEDIRGMYEDEIQQYIYNHLNKHMERKFIDEI